MKLPKDAKKVFDGVIFDVYQWEQQMYDGSTETFEMLKRADTTLIIPTANDKIYIVEEEQPHKGPFTGLLGGRVEEGEDPLTGAKRELLEEGGFISDDWELYTSYMPYTKLDWTISVYIARNCQKITEQKLDPGEKIAIKEVSFDDFVTLVTTSTFIETQFANEILRMRLHPPELDSFKATLF